MCSSGPEKEVAVNIFKIFLFHFLEETDIFVIIMLVINKLYRYLIGTYHWGFI